MVSERQINNFITVYTEIMKRLIDKQYTIRKGGENLKAIGNLFNNLSKEYGTVTGVRLVDFCIFSAYYYRNKPIQLKQAIGPTAVKKFIQVKAGMIYYQNQWLEDAELTRQKLYDMVIDRSEHPQAKYIYMSSEENVKNRMLNNEAGYFLCQTATLGWTPLSPSCNQCEFAEKCKRETQRKYPELYRIRLENGEKE